MTRRIWLAALLFLGLFAAPSFAQDDEYDLDIDGPDTAKVQTDISVFNKKLKGRLVDHTRNHGVDRRIWSRSMFQWRDVYIYLPPGYDKTKRYPFIMYLHGFCHDEESFLHVVPFIDRAIAHGHLPPCIVVAPDGSLTGCCCRDKPGSFFINSDAGPYEDYLLQDVWDFVTHNYPIRSEREAHVLAGVSMGGFGAFNIGIRQRNCFGAVVGIFPPLNLRWMSKEGNPRADFDPYRWGWREGFDNPHEFIGLFGPCPIRVGHLVHPVFGDGPEAVEMISANNPIELVDRCRLCNGELSMLIAYGGKDCFNIDAQVESFLYLAKYRGLGVHVLYDPKGHHTRHTANAFLPDIFAWLAPRLAPYSPTPFNYNPENLPPSALPPPMRHPGPMLP